MVEPTPAELNESAMNYFSRGNGIEAARQLQWALIGDPNYAEAWHNRAQVLRALNDPFDAILCCERAIEIDGNRADYHNTLGVCWASLSQYGRALHHYTSAVKMNPSLASAWHNLGHAHNLAGFYDDAVNAAWRAVELQPTNPDYHLSYAAALLRAGHLKKGFDEYEWRFKSSDAFHRNIPLPNWEGQFGATVILYAEQGFGDTIQFLRFAPTLACFHSLKIYVEVKKPLVELARTMSGIDGVIAYGDPLPEDATHALPIMSAARYCIDDDDNEIKYGLSCSRYFDPPKATRSFSSLSGLKVGLCWLTGVRPHQPELFEYRNRKSIAPEFLQPFGKIQGITWVSLQVPSSPLPFPMIDTGDLYDFMETAKLMLDLDVVVSVDTSVVHLAGALGISTILMTPRDNCWRWFADRSDSPWYPSLRQFRQPAPGDWPSVIEKVSDHLKELVEANGADINIRN